MCLYVNKEIDAEIEKKLKRNGKIRMWKVFQVYGEIKSGLCSIYRQTIYKPGWNISSVRGKHRRRSKSRTVSIGIHVYTNMKDAKEYSNGYNRVVLPVTCYAKDYIAGGSFCDVKSAVFAKVWLSKADYDSVC